MSENEAIRDPHDTDSVAYTSGEVSEDVIGDPDTVACTMNDAEVEKRAEWVRSSLLPHLEDVEERPDGYTLVFDGTDEALGAVMKFVHLESRCCSHATFEIAVQPGSEATRLSYVGTEETKELAYEGFISRIPDDVLD